MLVLPPWKNKFWLSPARDNKSKVGDHKNESSRQGWRRGQLGVRGPRTWAPVPAVQGEVQGLTCLLDEGPRGPAHCAFDGQRVVVVSAVIAGPLGVRRRRHAGGLAAGPRRPSIRSGSRIRGDEAPNPLFCAPCATSCHRGLSTICIFGPRPSWRPTRVPVVFALQKPVNSPMHVVF